MISLKDLKVSLTSGAGPVDILRGIDLEVAEGETFGLVGPSGSGKSTLLMVIAGLEGATSGDAIVAGSRLTEMSEDELALFRRDNVGIVFQSFHLIATMTALENVAVPLELVGVSDPMAKATQELEQVGLGHRLHHFPSQLSGGEQQRVAIARALAAGAKLILADEPTGNLDSQTGKSIIDLILSLRAKRAVTLLLVTHDEALAGHCDRVGVMGDGLLTEIKQNKTLPKKAAKRRSRAQTEQA